VCAVYRMKINQKRVTRQVRTPYTHTSSEVLLAVCAEDGGSLFLPSVANEGTFADSVST